MRRTTPPFPRIRSHRTSAPLRFACCDVSSVELLSYTYTRQCGSEWRKPATTDETVDASLRHGMRTATTGAACSFTMSTELPATRQCLLRRHGASPDHSRLDSLGGGRYHSMRTVPFCIA